MPLYTLINKETGEEVEHFFSSWKDKDAFLEDNPDLKQKLVAPNMVSQVGSNLSKTDDGWKDLLKTVKKGSGRGNTINT